MSNLQDMTLAFIGSGVMAEAMISRILNQELTDPSHMIASGPRPRGDRNWRSGTA